MVDVKLTSVPSSAADGQDWSRESGWENPASLGEACEGERRELAPLSLRAAGCFSCVVEAAPASCHLDLFSESYGESEEEEEVWDGAG